MTAWNKLWKAAAGVTFLLFLVAPSFANIFYVSITGNDVSGDGSMFAPWRSLTHAMSKVEASKGHTVQVGAGIFLENGLVEVPLGVSIVGAGIDITVLRAASSFYYHPGGDPGYSPSKFLVSLGGVNPLDGNQTLRNFTIDGDAKQLHGGIIVRYRKNVVIDHVKVQNTNYSGIWLWDVKDSQVSNTQLINCSWGSAGYCSGALNLGNLDHVEISQTRIEEDTGYGIKGLGPDGYNDVFYLKIHNCYISVDPHGLWNNGTAPNIAIELWQSTLTGCEIYNNYIDNTISLVNSVIPSTGIQTVWVHHNTFDLGTRAHGSGYGLELSVHDAEVDHNYFIRGNYGIANWDNPVQNWSIHHNIFYGLGESHIGEVLRSQRSGLHNVKFYNNTIEFEGNQTMNVVGLYGGTSAQLDIKNNLVINSAMGYNYYQNELIHTENSATIATNTLQVLHNSTTNLAPGGLIASLLGLLDPLIDLRLLPNPAVNATGIRPTPYYVPEAGSSLIDAGLLVGQPYAGSAPDIGALESGPVVAPNRPPLVSLLYPANQSTYPTYATGSEVDIAANASDPDGAIAKVEFFSDSISLGEATVSPYHVVWKNPNAGNRLITARATDNNNAITTSTPVLVTIVSDTLVDATKPMELPISIYPNPAKTTFNIEYFSDRSQQAEIHFYDMTARMVKQSYVTINLGLNIIPVEIGDLSNGIYRVSFITRQQKCTRSIVIVH